MFPIAARPIAVDGGGMGRAKSSISTAHRFIAVGVK
jgi:hypothetical protein